MNMLKKWLLAVDFGYMPNNLNFNLGCPGQPKFQTLVASLFCNNIICKYMNESILNQHQSEFAIKLTGCFLHQSFVMKLFVLNLR